MCLGGCAYFLCATSFFVLCFLLHNGEISKYIGKEMMINMALLFSAVTVTANNQEVEFLVGGIPREFDDLEGWTAFDNFMEAILRLCCGRRWVFGAFAA